VKNEVLSERLAELQYVSCADPRTLAELEGEIADCLLSMAVFVGQTRLIDNVLLPEQVS
jgi:pantoate--beta-alanine ligase